MTPRTKLLVACLALAALLGVATFNGVSSAAAARAVLAVAALAGLCWWWLRNRRSPSKKFQLAPRLAVVSRAGLSNRTSLALVEVDGRSFLVVHGDGYAEICSTARAATEKRPAKARPPRATDSLPKFAPGGVR